MIHIIYIFIFFRVQPPTRPSQLDIMAFCPEHPKWDQNPNFSPLSEPTSIPTPFHMRVPATVWNSNTSRHLGFKSWDLGNNFVTTHDAMLWETCGSFQRSNNWKCGLQLCLKEAKSGYSGSRNNCTTETGRLFCQRRPKQLPFSRNVFEFSPRGLKLTRSCDKTSR